MRHRVADKKFNRDANQRRALFVGLLRNLTEHGEIVTTLAKAKAVKRLADRMVTQAKINTVASRRVLHQRFGKRDVVSTLVNQVAPAMSDRQSGYVTLTAIGSRRGDNTPMAKLAFVKKPAKSGLKNPTKLASAKTVVSAATKVKADSAVSPTAQSDTNTPVKRTAKTRTSQATKKAA